MICDTCRLDRIYINATMLDKILKSDIRPSLFSDHPVTTFSFKLALQQHGSPYWKFNVMVLETVTFCEAFRVFWNSLIERKNSLSNPRLWWDYAKAQIAVFCQQFNHFSSFRAKKERAVFEKEILKLQSDVANNPSTTNNHLLLEKRPF